MNDETIIQVLNRVMYIIFENLLKFTFIRYTLYCGVVRSEYGKDDETLMENIIDIFV